MVLLYRLLVAQKLNVSASLISVALLSTMPVFWSQAIRAEVYTIHSFLIISILLTWWNAHTHQKKFLFFTCFVLLGISMGHHLTAALLWVAILVCLLWENRQWQSVAIASSFFGMLIIPIVYSYFPLRSIYTPRIDYIHPYFNIDVGNISIIWWLLSAQAFHCAFYIDYNPISLSKEFIHLLILLWDNSLGIGVILAAWGWQRLRENHPLWCRLLSLYFLVNVVAFLSYHVVDKEVMFIPIFIIGSIWLANGIQALKDWMVARLDGVSEHYVIPSISGLLMLLVSLGVWFNWSTVSLHQDSRVYDFAVQIIHEVEPSTIIVSHWVTASVLDYVQVVDGKRADVTIFNLEFYGLGLQKQCDQQSDPYAQQAWFDWIHQHVRQRPLCFIEPLPAIPNDLRWANRGSCWTLTTAMVQ
jgi:hypothetical protein